MEPKTTPQCVTINQVQMNQNVKPEGNIKSPKSKTEPKTPPYNVTVIQLLYLSCSLGCVPWSMLCNTSMSLLWAPGALKRKISVQHREWRCAPHPHSAFVSCDPSPAILLRIQGDKLWLLAAHIKLAKVTWHVGGWHLEFLRVPTSPYPFPAQAQYFLFS